MNLVAGDARLHNLAVRVGSRLGLELHSVGKCAAVVGRALVERGKRGLGIVEVVEDEDGRAVRRGEAGRVVLDVSAEIVARLLRRLHDLELASRVLLGAEDFGKRLRLLLTLHDALLVAVGEHIRHLKRTVQVACTEGVARHRARDVVCAVGIRDGNADRRIRHDVLLGLLAAQRIHDQRLGELRRPAVVRLYRKALRRRTRIAQCRDVAQRCVAQRRIVAVLVHELRSRHDFFCGVVLLAGNLVGELVHPSRRLLDLGDDFVFGQALRPRIYRLCLRLQVCGRDFLVRHELVVAEERIHLFPCAALRHPADECAASHGKRHRLVQLQDVLRLHKVDNRLPAALVPCRRLSSLGVHKLAVAPVGAENRVRYVTLKLLEVFLKGIFKMELPGGPRKDVLEPRAKLLRGSAYRRLHDFAIHHLRYRQSAYNRLAAALDYRAADLAADDFGRSLYASRSRALQHRFPHAVALRGHAERAVRRKAIFVAGKLRRVCSGFLRELQADANGPEHVRKRIAHLRGTFAENGRHMPLFAVLQLRRSVLLRRRALRDELPCELACKGVSRRSALLGRLVGKSVGIIPLVESRGRAEEIVLAKTKGHL